MPDPARIIVERWALDLLRELSTRPGAGGPLRVAEAAGGLACLVVVWPAGQPMPTARGKRKRGGREQCRVDVLAVLRAVGHPLTRKEVIGAVREQGLGHGPGTVAKALADLTASRVLVNHMDKRGYRLPEWSRPHPTLFPSG